MSLQDFKNTFDPELVLWMQKRIYEAQLKTQNSSVMVGVRYLERLVMSGGKRIRPFLAYLANQTAGGTLIDNQLLIGLEVFHNFCLIHDDIIDGATERHGVPTVEKFYEQVLRQGEKSGDVLSVARSQAILLGDLLFAWAHTCFLDTTPAIKREWISLVEDVVIGQMMDVDMTTELFPSAGAVQAKNDLKTARYSFMAPMRIGFAASQSTDIDFYFEFAERFGMSLGRAFQLQDDLFDIVSSQERLHKNVLMDLQQRQHTFFTEHILTRGSAEQRQQLLNLFGQTNSNPQIVLQLFQESGALEYGEKLLEKEFLEARLALTILPASQRDAWEAVIKVVKERKN